MSANGPAIDEATERSGHPVPGPGLRGVLRAAAARARGGPEDRATETAFAAWPLALARAAADAAGLDLAVPQCHARHLSLAEVIESLPDPALILTLAGPGHATGLVALSSDLLAALIEQQTLGRVLERPAAPRRPTRTDAALASGMLDAALAGLAQAVPGAAWLAGHRCGSLVEARRSLPLLLDEGAYRCAEAVVLPGGTARAGRLFLALPVLSQSVQAPDGAAGADGFAAQLREVVGTAEAVLTAVVARVTLPLDAVMALAPGDVLPLPRAALDAVDLIGLDGARVAGGHLGQSRGMRAVRLGDAAVAVQAAPVVPAARQATVRRGGVAA